MCPRTPVLCEGFLYVGVFEICGECVCTCVCEVLFCAKGLHPIRIKASGLGSAPYSD